MKKWIFAAALLITGVGKIHALPFGNPAEPSFLTRGVFWGGTCPNTRDPCNLWFDTWSFRVGFYGDWVYDRRLRIQGAGYGYGLDMRDTQINTNAAYAVINLGNRLDVFGTAGVSRLSIFQNELSWNSSPATNLDSLLQTDTSFSWSVGVRGSLLCWRGFTFGAEGQYFSFRPEFERYITGIGTELDFTDDNRVKYMEWQAGIGLSYTITCRDPDWEIIPYAGLKWAWVRFRTNDFSFTVTDPVIGTRTLTIFNLKEQLHMGYALGVSLIAWGNTAFTLEGRWVSEKALYFNTQFRF